MDWIEKFAYSITTGTLLAVLVSFFIGVTIGGMKRTYPPQEVVCIPQDTLDDWHMLQIAIMIQESELDPLAVGKTNDLGIMQITPVYVREVNRICGDSSFVHTDAFSIDKSLQMFSITQEAKNPERDLMKALQIHNPKGDTIGYSKRVLQKIDWVKKYENVRNKVVER